MDLCSIRGRSRFKTLSRDRGYIDFCKIGGVAVEGQGLASDFADAQHLADQELGIASGFVVEGWIAVKQVAEIENGLEWIVHLMSDAGCHAPNGGHVLRFDECRLGLLRVR